MYFRRIFVLFICSLVSLSFSADREIEKHAFDPESEIFGSNDPCYEATPVEDGDGLLYMLYDHILVSAADRVSRCIILKDVPYSGYYGLEVKAGYSLINTEDQQKENYILVIESDTLKEMQDENLEPPDNYEGRYLWKWRDHGYQKLEKGDVKVYFLKGSQDSSQARINSVDFKAIRVVPPPHIEEEPTFTANYSNTIEWIPLLSGAVTQDVFYYDSTTAIVKTQTNFTTQGVRSDTFKTSFFGDLKDGHTYGYYVEAYTEDGRMLRSDTTFSTQDASPPGRVTLESIVSYANSRVELNWRGVDDAVSSVVAYHIVRSEDDSIWTKVATIDTIHAKDVCAGIAPADSSDKPYYCYTDELDPEDSAKKRYKYRIDAVDSVRNISTGYFSDVVINIPKPHLGVTPEFDADEYYKGHKVTVYSDLADTLLPKSSHKIRFQAARDFLKFFDNKEADDTHFFDSNWIDLENDMNTISYIFDLSDSARNGVNFVDGHRYYLRAQLCDIQGNMSEWTFLEDSLIIPDSLPPDDITFLDVQPITNESNTLGYMNLNWGGAVDHTSGIKEYIVYRKIDSVGAKFDTVATPSEPHYEDTFKDIKYNGNVIYRIGSIDRVGNKRDTLNTNHIVTVRSQSAMRCTIIPINGDIENGIKTTTIRDIFLRCDYRHFEEQDSITFIPQINGVEGAPLKPSVGSEELFLYTLPAQPDTYRVSIKALFPTKDISLWSVTDTIIYKTGKNASHNEVLKDQKKLASTNYPNPFNPTTSITYVLEKDSHVNVDIYNIQGRKIKSLTNEFQNKGTHSVVWNGDNESSRAVSSGIYYYRIEFDGQNEQRTSIIKRMLLVK